MKSLKVKEISRGLMEQSPSLEITVNFCGFSTPKILALTLLFNVY